MTKPLLLHFFLLSAFAIKGFAQQDTTSINKTHWLIGSWKGTWQKGAFYETWRKGADNSLICYSVSIKDADTSVKVNSLIRLKDGVVVFEDPQVWKAKRLVSNEMTFERQDTKGHYRIIWMQTTDNRWWAVLQYPSATMYFDLVSMPDLDRAINKYLPQ